tara:strand:+ start:96 stop:590 length:495 start_codon:yes stop_codon:yes gene_type:complete
MTPFDAAKILSLTGEITPEAVKIAYREAAKKYHPDVNAAGAEMMKAVNAAFDALKNYTGNIEPGEGGLGNYPEMLNDALNAIINLAGLEIEICGAWVWVGGDTKTHKEALKAAAFRWANKKKMWYFRPEDWKGRRNRKEFSIDEIRATHGSETVKGTGQRVIAA